MIIVVTPSIYFHKKNGRIRITILCTNQLSKIVTKYVIRINSPLDSAGKLRAKADITNPWERYISYEILPRNLVILFPISSLRTNNSTVITKDNPNKALNKYSPPKKYVFATFDIKDSQYNADYAE